MFCRILNLADIEFKMDNIEENGLSEKIMLITEDPKTLLPSNHNSELKPLGDINIKIEDIISCKYCFIIYTFPLYL